MSNQKGYTLVEVMFLVVWLLAIIGWVLNIIALMHMTLNPVTMILILRIIGIFVMPLGVILGFVPA